MFIAIRAAQKPRRFSRMAAKTIGTRPDSKLKLYQKVKTPVYAIKYAENEHPIIGFSKTFDAAFNPKSEFAAVMTCSHADANCPFIPGAEKRIPVKYDDPKAFDNTSQQAEKYKERSSQIAAEMFYVFSKVSQLTN